MRWWGAGVVIGLERGADLHMAQLMPLPLTVSCFSKIQIGFIILVSADPGSPGKGAVKRVYVCMYVYFMRVSCQQHWTAGPAECSIYRAKSDVYECVVMQEGRSKSPIGRRRRQRRPSELQLNAASRVQQFPPLLASKVLV